MADSKTAKTTTKPVAREPLAILERMIQAYQAASSYQDRGEVRLRYRQQGQPAEDTANLAVQLERPNRLRVEAYQLLLACDGKTLRAQIMDPPSENLDHQVVVRPAPERWTLAELYTDTVLYEVISSGLGRHPIQLELLLSDEPLNNFLEPAITKQLLQDAEIDDHRCFRVEVQAEEGKFVFWIDQQDFVLRRLEYPTEELEKQIAAVEQVEQLQLVADFHAARFNQTIDRDLFTLSVPADAKPVRFFVIPPQPLPSDLFGKKPDSFAFAKPQGGTVTSQSLQGKIAVLMWFNNSPACRMALEQLQPVWERFGADQQVELYAVSTEPSTVSNAELLQILQQWGVAVPLVRDLQAYGRDVFQIPVAPTLVVLDPKGVVQIFEAGANPNLQHELPQILERLLAQDDLASQIRRQYEQEQELYAQSLAIAQGEGNGEVMELPPTRIQPASDPQHVQLSPLWSTTELEAPGNILVYQHQEHGPQILVHDGWRTVVELDAQGKLVSRHVLELPERAAVSYLRTAVDNQGRRLFAASALLAPQVFLLDDQWNVQLSYPPVDQPHDGLRDVRLEDLDGDQQPELYAGYWGPVGVQAVSLQGELLWSNRSVSNVLSLAVSPPNDVGWRRLLVSQDQGDLRRINHYGHHDPPLVVEGQLVHQLYAAPWSTAASADYCGISYQMEGQLLAIGLDQDFQTRWTYPLPVGIYRSQVQFVTSGSLAQQNVWWFAGPDGTVHVVNADGQFQDHFSHGRYITGMATFRQDDQDVLLLASEKDVTAWRVTRADEAAAREGEAPAEPR